MNGAAGLLPNDAWRLLESPSVLAAGFDLTWTTPAPLKAERATIMKAFLVRERTPDELARCVFYDQVDAFAEGEDKSGLNCVYLLAHACEESAWGTSNLARTRRNLYGWNAIDFKVTKMAARFATARDSVLVVSGKIAHLYVSPGGRFSRPLSPTEFERALQTRAWNQANFRAWWERKRQATVGAKPNTLNCWNGHYASNPQWSYNIARIMLDFFKFYMETHNLTAPTN